MVDKNMIDNIDLKFVRQDHYTSGGLDTMQLIDAKFPEEPVMEQVGGWHFNVRSTIPIEWPEAVIDANPVTPWRVWG